MTEQTSDKNGLEQQVGYPDGIEAHISHKEAVQTVKNDSPDGIESFIAALGMQKPVSNSVAISLFETIVKNSDASDAKAIADTMRLSNWEALLSPGEDLSTIAKHAADFLASPPGIEVFNFFIKTFAKTTDSMF
jgi:hypothetical protein